MSISDDQYNELGNQNYTLLRFNLRNQFTECFELLTDILKVSVTKKSLRDIAYA